MTRRKLLLLSGGCQVGRNVLATLAGRRAGLELHATSSVVDEPALFDFDAVYRVPVTAADPAGFETRLLAILAGEAIDLVIPCRDDDVVFLAGLRDRRPELAPRLLCGSSEAALAISDKWLGYSFCRRHGLPFVETLCRASAGDREAFIRAGGLPCIAKPRRGFASRDVRLLWTAAQLEAALADPQCVVQRFIGEPGVVAGYLDRIQEQGLPLTHTFKTWKHSIQVLVGPEGGTVHVIATRNRLDMPRAKEVTADPEPASRELGERCAAAFSAAGWRGPLNIQCQKAPDGALAIHEFNGRFTGATAVRWRLGFDEVGAAIAAFTGRPVDAAPGAQPPASIALEGLASRAADPADVAALAREGSWRAPSRRHADR
jgi:carbamoyl-phosphate synthase large subunit